jgi:spermidine synthase
VSFTFSHAHEPRVHFEEDVHGGMTTVTQQGGTLLWTNGKFQRDNGAEMVAQRGFAPCPVLFLKKFDRVLNIGFGTGITAGTLARPLPIPRDRRSGNRAVNTPSFRLLPRRNGHVLSDPRVKVHVVEGRNYLLLTDRRYDVIP